MKNYIIQNNYGTFVITEFDNGEFFVHGNRKAVVAEFKKINRMSPNRYGNFYGREKAGYKACREIIGTH